MAACLRNIDIDGRAAARGRRTQQPASRQEMQVLGIPKDREDWLPFALQSIDER